MEWNGLPNIETTPYEPKPKPPKSGTSPTGPIEATSAIFHQVNDGAWLISHRQNIFPKRTPLAESFRSPFLQVFYPLFPPAISHFARFLSPVFLG